MTVLCGYRLGTSVVRPVAGGKNRRCVDQIAPRIGQISPVGHLLLGKRCAGVSRPLASQSEGAFATNIIPNSHVTVTTIKSRDDSGIACQQLSYVAVSLAVCVSIQCALLVCPGAAHASGGALSSSALEVFRQWLQYVDSLGNWGPFLFIATVVAAEMIPLFPTQPISLASGLLFGPVKGTIFVLIGVTLAAVNAFLISRGVGSSLAKKVIAAEVGEGHGASGGMLQSKLAEIQKAIASGSFLQQCIAIVLLRLTPVVPYSASNYILGLTPLPLAPFVVGTAAGMLVWAIVYASLGGASRAVLTSGASFSTLFADLAERSGAYTATIALAAVGLGVAVAIYKLVTPSPKPDAPQAAAPLPAAAADSSPSPSSSGGSSEAGGDKGSSAVVPQEVVPVQQKT